MLEDLLRILAAFSWHVTLIDVICLTWRITNTVYTILSVSIKFILFQFFFSLSLFLSCISFVSIRHQRHMYLISLPEEQTNVSEKKKASSVRVCILIRPLKLKMKNQREKQLKHPFPYRRTSCFIFFLAYSVHILYRLLHRLKYPIVVHYWRNICHKLSNNVSYCAPKSIIIMIAAMCMYIYVYKRVLCWNEC